MTIGALVSSIGLLFIMYLCLVIWRMPPCHRYLYIPVERVIAQRTGEVRGGTLRIWLDGEGVIPITGLKLHSGALVKVAMWEV